MDSSNLIYQIITKSLKISSLTEAIDSLTEERSQLCHELSLSCNSKLPPRMIAYLDGKSYLLQWVENPGYMFAEEIPHCGQIDFKENN